MKPNPSHTDSCVKQITAATSVGTGRSPAQISSLPFTLLARQPLTPKPILFIAEDFSSSFATICRASFSSLAFLADI